MSDKKRKSVKKNTWLRRLKAWDLRLDRRQRDDIRQPESDDTPRVCVNCGMEFAGRYCPQCGQDGTWNRHSWKRNMVSFFDFLGLGKSSGSGKSKKLLMRKKKKRKPVKKNTWRRKLKAWDLRYDHRMSDRHIETVADNTIRVCANCGSEYTGRYCPQCGQTGVWNRYSWRQAILNFLDIWGLGNRPMFRTIHQLFWRPGYMVRDYLEGRRQFYFPPFKLLAVMAVLLAFVGWITGSPYESVFDGIEDINFSKWQLSPTIMAILEEMQQFLIFLSSNILYETLALGVIGVICIWIIFGRLKNYNFVETYIFLVYVLAQFFICMIPFNLIDGGVSLLQQRFLEVSSGNVLEIARTLTAAVCGVWDLVSDLFYVFLFLLIVRTFRQFYGLGWWATFRRLLWSGVVAFLMLGAVALIGLTLVKRGAELALLELLVFACVSASFLYTRNLLSKNRGIFSAWVYKTCRLAWLPLFLIPVFFGLSCYKFGIKWYFIVTTACVIGAATVPLVTMLSVYLQRRYHRGWLTVLPTLLLYVAFIMCLVGGLIFLRTG